MGTVMTWASPQMEPWLHTRAFIAVNTPVAMQQSYACNQARNTTVAHASSSKSPPHSIMSHTHQHHRTNSPVAAWGGKSEQQCLGTSWFESWPGHSAMLE